MTADNPNRSEQLRLRRNAQSSRRVTSAAHRAVSERSAPARPVTVRNTTFGAPINPRVATANPRRQFYVALDAPGAELRLPALPSLRPSARTLSSLIVIATLIALFSLLYSSVFVVAAPRVNGLTRLTQTDIESALDLANLSVVQVDAAAIRGALLTKYPILKDVSVGVGLPNSLTISVKERKPLVSWKIKDKESWIDAEGVLFPPAGKPDKLLAISADAEPPLYVSPENQKALLLANQQAAQSDPVQTALPLPASPKKDGPDKVDPTLLDAAVKLSTHLPAGTILVFSQLHGLGWQDKGGWEVFVGTDLANFDQKFALYQAIDRQLNGMGITPALISVELMSSPYYRMEK